MRIRRFRSFGTEGCCMGCFRVSGSLMKNLVGEDARGVRHQTVYGKNRCGGENASCKGTGYPLAVPQALFPGVSAGAVPGAASLGARSSTIALPWAAGNLKHARRSARPFRFLWISLSAAYTAITGPEPPIEAQRFENANAARHAEQSGRCGPEEGGLYLARS